MALFTRSETPPATSRYREFKPFLRRDFLLRCAYCERTEAYLGGEEFFEVEHFRPKSRFPALVCVYENLYYACRACNAHKSETWPSREQENRNHRFVDPCEEDPYIHHLRDPGDGRPLEELTSCGAYSNRHIRLDRQELRRWRRLRSEARHDLPFLTGVASMLEQMVASGDAVDRDRAADRLAAVRRRIEESKLRFSIE